MSYFLSPIGNNQIVDANGAPLSGGLIYTYLAGTTTPATTYADNAGTAQTNPIVLNSAGRPTLGPIWLLGGQAVKLVVQNSSGVTQYTYDNVSGVNDPSNASTADQWVVYTAAPAYISATSFSVTGDQTGTFQVGRRVKSATTGGTVYSTISASSYSSGTGLTTVTVANDSGTLDSGLSAVSYGLLSVTNPSIPESATGKAIRLGSIPAFSYGQTISQNLTSGAAAAKITFTSQDFDFTGGMFASSRFTPTVAGLYKINAAVYLQATTLTSYAIYVYKNGALYKRGATAASLSGNAWQTQMDILVSLNGTTDYIEIFADAAGTGTIFTNALASVTYFQGVLVRPA